MTPAEHRAEAQMLLDQGKEFALDEAEPHVVAIIHQRAQVHALLALSPTAPTTPPKPKPAQQVAVFDVELRDLIVTTTAPNGGSVILHHPSSEWSTLIDSPEQVRKLADTLTWHADRMENKR